VLDGAFEQVLPVRGFGSYRGSAASRGLWWSCTISDHVGYESWNGHLIATGITVIAPTSGTSRRWTPPGCGPPSSTPSWLLEDSLTGD
jgi:hypothetical protein